MALPPRILTADRGDAGRRLDLMVRRHLSGVDAASRTRVQAWIENGLVTVNGAPVRRVSARTAFGDVVAVVLPEPVAHPVMAAEDVGLDVLYEDDYLLAINKPAGVVVHPTYRHAAGTVMNALLWHARTWPTPQRPSIVGRLDKLTSGIVIVAKSSAIHAALQRAMASKHCEKDYLALVYGRVNVARGRIDLRLGRDRGDRRRIVASATVGAASVTEFERLARAPGLALLRCRLVTGRTHQIRVHLASRGWPIVGDPVYGKPLWSQVPNAALAASLRAFPRQALHAWRIALTHPVTGDRLRVEAPIPRDLKGLLALPRCFMKAGVFVALAIAATLIACGGGSSNSANSPTTPSGSTSSSPAPQQSLTIVADSTTHEIGRSYLLTALLRVSGQPDKDVSKDAQWRSSNTSVATMQANTLTIRGLGEVDIAVDYQQQTGSYHLSISMGQVVFNVDSGVSSADQDLIRDAANLALSYFSSTFGWAPTQQITVKIVASGGLQDPGGSNVTAVTGGSTVTVYVNSPWWTIAPSTGTTFSKQTIIVSEFFHVLQYSIGWLVLGLQPDVLWLADGGAGYVASRATIIDRGLQSADQVRGCHQYAVDHSSPSIPALVQLEGQNFYVFNGQGAATYDIAYLATEQATQARGVGALMTFGLTASSGWQNAFQQAFGISVNDFYSSFEQYRRTWHAPADFACG